jgi:hypothetical protein
MRKLILLIFCAAMLLGGSFLAYIALSANSTYYRAVFGGATLAVAGGYLIWTDFIAPRLGIRTWED